MDLGLTEATALVAGGTRGIGLASAVALANEGCRVALVGRDPDRLDAAAEAVIGAGSPHVLTLRADLASGDGLATAFDHVAAQWGALNVLINAAGPGFPGGFERLDDEAWHDAFNDGVVTTVRSVRLALPLLRAADWARIVNVTAMSVQHQSPALISYTAAKAALAAVTKNLARSLAPEGILVNAVAPGPILTDWARPSLDKAGIAGDDPGAAYDLFRASRGMSIDLGRLGRADEVAAMIVFCASRRNGFMTGAHINVDGGSDFV